MSPTVSIQQSIASVYTGLMQGVGAAEKVFEYISRVPELPQDGQEAPDTCQGLVEFKNVTFSYPTRPETPILKVRLVRSGLVGQTSQDHVASKQTSFSFSIKRMT